MEVRAGYKQTEVGVIPEEWKVKSLGEIGESLIGLTYRPSQVRADGTLVLRSSNVQDGSLCFDDNVFVEAKIPERIMVRSDDILVCVRNGSRDLIGKCALIDKRAVGMTFGAFMAVFRSDHGKFLHQVFQSNLFKKQIHEHLGATINQITNKSLNSFKVPMPPTSNEQQAIANALRDVDELITSLDKLITKKRNLKQAAMQQLLTGKSRLQGFSGEWEQQSIASLEKQGLVRLSRGKVISKKDIERMQGSYPIYSSSIHNQGLFGLYGQFMFDDEMITWSVDGGGNFFYRPKHKFSVTNVCGFMRVTSSKINCRFLAYQLQHLHSKKKFDYQSKAHPSVVRKEYVVYVPNNIEQNLIADALSDIDAEIFELEQRRDKTNALKQGMMQELLTGRTRLA